MKLKHVLKCFIYGWATAIAIVFGCVLMTDFLNWDFTYTLQYLGQDFWMYTRLELVGGAILGLFWHFIFD